MFKASNSKHEVKQEAEFNSIAILKELKLFFTNNKHQNLEPQDCERYNRILEAHNAVLVYDEEERTHKLWLNDEPLDSQSAIQVLSAIIESLEPLNTQTDRTPKTASSTTSPTNTYVQEQVKPSASGVGRDKIKIKGGIVAGGQVHFGDVHNIYINHVDGAHIATNNPVSPPLDEADLNAKAAQLVEQLKLGYCTSEYTTIPGIFGPSLKLEGQYINLQILCTDLKTIKPREDKELKESLEAKPTEKYKDARMASVEDLFGDKRVIKTEDLFKPTRELFNNQVLEAKNSNEIPRLLLVQGRAGIGKTTFVRYAAHQWSRGQLYTNYTWVFTLTLRKLRLLPKTPELSLSEWIRLSQFSDWSTKEFDELWQQSIEGAIHQNQVLLILDGYDETPEEHPCQSILEQLLSGSGRYAKLNLLITTRPVSAEKISQKRRNLEIIGFTDANINEYIQSYFESSEEILVNTFTEALRKQPIIWANAHIPLNLNLLCGIMEEAIQKAQADGLNQALAGLSSMTRLYQVMEKKLYERSYTRRDAVLPNVVRLHIRAASDFTQHYEKERLFLAKLAFQSFESERIIISLQAIGDTLAAYVDKEAPQNQQQKEALGDAFFKTVCELGLIKPVLDKSGLSQTKQDYEFLHLTFQEYYTAIYIASRLSSKESAAQTFAQSIIAKEKYNPRWQIVWWFVAGLLRENTPVYQAYLQQLQGQSATQKDIFEHYPLGLLTRCIDEGFSPQNQQVIEPIVKELQLGFLRLYQIAKNVTNNDSHELETLAFINSPFFSACRISLNLCMNGRQDLYELISESNELEDRYFLSEWIGAIRVITPKALDVFLELLSDKKSDARLSVARALGKLNNAAATPKIVEALLGLLSHKNRDMRSSAASALGNLGEAATEKAVAVLLRLLSHENSHVCSSAAEALGNLGEAFAIPEVVNALLQLLSSKKSNVRLSAARALGKLNNAAVTPKVVEALLGLLSHKNCDVRSSAAEALGELAEAAATPEVLGALLELLSDDEGLVSDCVALTLSCLGKAITPKVVLLDTLQERLFDKDNSDMRRHAADAVGYLGEAVATPNVLDRLLRLLSDEDKNVRSSAARALRALNDAAATPEVVDVLLALLSDSDKGCDVRYSAVEADVRSFAAKTLGYLGKVAMTKVMDALLALLSDKDRIVRSSAAAALGNLGTTAAKPQILEALLSLLSDKDSGVRSSAAVALGNLSTAAATPPILNKLLKLLSDKDSRVRHSVTRALGRLGRALGNLDRAKILDALLRLLSDKDDGVRSSAAAALGNLSTSAATPLILNALLERFSDEDRDVRISATKAFDKLSNTLAPPAFLDWLLTISSAENNNKTTLYCFETRIETVFTLMPSVGSEHANHPNILAFVSYALAIAYLNSRIVCQIGFDKEGANTGYYMRGVVGKSRYRILITEEQAQILERLSPLVIEQLSKTGRLDIADLEKQLKCKPMGHSLERGEVIMHAESECERKGSPLLRQYQQGFRDSARADQNQVRGVCRIS